MKENRAFTIEGAVPEDAEELVAIYDYYVQNTAITFEYETPTAAEFRRRIENTLGRFPYLVLRQDGRIRGYAYAGPFRTRAAYDWCCETSIYLRRGATKCGMGRALYQALEKALGQMGILNMYAVVACPEEKEDEYLTSNSLDFHRHLGFEQAGLYHRCGYKFGRWYHMVWMEKHIGDHADTPLPVVWG